MSEKQSLNNILIKQAKSYEKKTLYTFLNSNGDEFKKITYVELLKNASSLSQIFKKNNLEKECAILILPQGPEFIYAFFACLYAGIIAVPIPPPKFSSLSKHCFEVIKKTSPNYILTTNNFKKTILESTPQKLLKNLEILCVTDIKEDIPHSTHCNPVHDIAFLQFTSGSTSEPKGVLIKHKNILQNEKMIQEAFGHDENSTVVGWLPFFHDMGLIGNIIQPLYAGASAILFRPETFIKNPLIWLKIISKYKAHTSGGPNFAFENCVKAFEKNKSKLDSNIDLSDWKIAFNGSEPIQASTIEKFTKTFQPFGFNQQSFFPCYGMAETTLFVSGAPKLTGARSLDIDIENLIKHNCLKPPKTKKYRIISSGIAHPSQTLLIVNPENLQLLNDGQIGEVCINGENVADGYWKDSIESRNRFDVSIPDRPGLKFFRTGDLGCLLNNELYITGRLKDIIIFRGKNYYPQDIESLFKDGLFENIYPIVFSPNYDTERQKLILALGLPSKFYDAKKYQEIIQHAQYEINKEFSLSFDDILFIPRRDIPYTTSGKIQRNRFLIKFEQSELQILHRLQQASPNPKIDPSYLSESNKDLHQFLVSRLNRQIKISERKQPLIHLGIDSLHGIELLHHLESEYLIKLTMEELLYKQSLSSLALKCDEYIRDKSSSPLLTQKTLSEGALSLGQTAMLYMCQIYPDQSQYHFIREFSVQGVINQDLFKRSLAILLEKNPALRTIIKSTSKGPRQKILEVDECSFFYVSDVEDSKRFVESLREQTKLFNTALFQVYLLNCIDKQKIILLLHHIISDLWSVSILLSQWKEIYEALENNILQDIPEQSGSVNYLNFVLWQEAHISSSKGLQEEKTLLQKLNENYPPLQFPSDFPRPNVQSHSAKTLPFSLSKRSSNRLFRLAKERGYSLSSICLTAYFTLLYRYTGQENIIIGVPFSGRSQKSFQKMVGYFVNTLPICRNDLAKETFASLLDKINKDLLTCHELQNYPVVKLIEKLKFSRELGSSSFYQALFTFQAFPDKDEALCKMVMEQEFTAFQVGTLQLFPSSSRSGIDVDIDLALSYHQGSLIGYLKYNTDILLGSTTERVLNHYINILKNAPKILEKPLDEIMILSKREFKKQVETWNKHDKIYHSPQTLNSFVEKISALHPNHTAIVEKGKTMTYQELEIESQELGNFLSEIRSRS